MKSLTLVGVVTLVLLLALLAPPKADAYYFYWSKIEVQSKSWQGCMNLVYGVAQQHNLTQLRRTNLSITGSLSGADATITCIGTGANSKAMAVVMVVGDSDAPVKQLHDSLVDAVRKVVFFD